MEYQKDRDDEISTTQELLLFLLPQWNAKIARPFKQSLGTGISMEMYYCIQTLRFYGGALTMTDLAKRMRTPKQQMTKIVNRLVENGFVRRIYDSMDRRMIKVQVTDQASKYIEYFLKQKAGCFKILLEQMEEQQRVQFRQSIEVLHQIFLRLPTEETMRTIDFF